MVDTTSVDAAPNASQSQAKERRRKGENYNKDEEAPPIVIEMVRTAHRATAHRATVHRLTAHRAPGW